jgi:hypothetical protein
MKSVFGSVLAGDGVVPAGWWLAVVLLLPAPCSQGQIVCSEVMADNRTAVEHAGAFPDYIELHNAGVATVSLAGMSLTDDPALPRKFVFGAGVALPAGGYLVVWADTATGTPGLHTGFGLGAKGDLVRLYAADGQTVLDAVEFGLQVPDLAIGRVTGAGSGWTLVSPGPGQPNVAVNLAAAAELRINEWMARPVSGEDWLEVFNPANQPVALGGLILTDTATGRPNNRPIPDLSFIQARGYVPFFASDLAKPDADHLDFKLSTEGETLRLMAADRITVLDQVTFGEQTTGVAQGRAPDGGETLVFFPDGGETPGKANFAAIEEVAISEVLSHSDPPFEDAIELVNLTDVPQNIGHWWLSDGSSQPRKYRIPAGTTLAPRGFAVFYEYQFGAGTTGFGLDSAEGDQVHLSAGDASGNLTGRQTFVTFGALENGISAGRHATSQAVDFVPLVRPTFGVDVPASLAQFRRGTGAANAVPRVGPVVFSELQFRPPAVASSDPTGIEFLELHNVTDAAVTFYDVEFPTNTWRLRGGVSFDFPSGVTLPAGGCLVVVEFDPAVDAARLAAFRTHFAVPPGVPVFGPYSGSLSDSGEVVELLRPDEPEGMDDPNAGFVPYLSVERIQYASAAPWPSGAAGTGRSLQRRIAFDYGNDSGNWLVAAPSPGRFAAANTDADQDGMEDGWEIEHGLDPGSPADAGFDPDGDRATNHDEFVAGTDPRDADSVCRITRILRTGTGCQLSFPAVEGRSYDIEYRPDWGALGWQVVTNFPVASTANLDVEVTVPAGPAGIFRLNVQSLP